MKLLLTSTLYHFSPKLPLIFGNDLKNMNMLCIPTAAYVEDGYEKWLTPELETIKYEVNSFIEFDIKNKLSSDLKVALKNIDILYVTGGNTFYLLEAMNKIGFKEVLGTFFSSGGIYLGSSAGSIVICPDIDFVKTMDDPSKANLDSTLGLNLVNFLIMPHINQPKFNDKFKLAFSKIDKTIDIMGLNDDQALWIEDNYVQFY